METKGSVGIYATAIASIIVGALILPRLELGTPLQVVGAILGMLAFASLLVVVGLVRDRRSTERQGG